MYEVLLSPHKISITHRPDVVFNDKIHGKWSYGGDSEWYYLAKTRDNAEEELFEEICRRVKLINGAMADLDIDAEWVVE